ncbi:MAG: hypothetical protein ACYDEQ_10335 [Desulfocucumaceae bacterium]
MEGILESPHYEATKGKAVLLALSRHGYPGYLCLRWEIYLKRRSKLFFICLIGFIILAVSTFYVWIYLLHGSDLNNNVFIESANITESAIFISGDTSNSGISYRGFNYKVSESKMYIRTRYGLVTKKYSSGHFDIKINTNEKYIPGICG